MTKCKENLAVVSIVNSGVKGIQPYEGARSAKKKSQENA
jgi:hypothetical protein